jgi:hypothetical protein
MKNPDSTWLISVWMNFRLSSLGKMNSYGRLKEPQMSWFFLSRLQTDKLFCAFGLVS